MPMQQSNPYGVQTRLAPVVELKEGDCPLALHARRLHPLCRSGSNYRFGADVPDVDLR